MCICCFGRIWRARRLVWTKETLYISRPNNLEITDTIPLEEIDEVLIMEEKSDKKTAMKWAAPTKPISVDFAESFNSPDRQEISPSHTNSKTVAFLSQAGLSNVLHIKTAEQGINSGRTYYISTRSNPDAAECRIKIVEQLTVLARVARRKAEAKSRFQRTQQNVRVLQSSFVFQMVMASLIVLVKSVPSSLQHCATRALTISHIRAIARARTCVFAHALAHHHALSRPDLSLSLSPYLSLPLSLYLSRSLSFPPFFPPSPSPSPSPPLSLSLFLSLSRTVSHTNSVSRIKFAFEH